MKQLGGLRALLKVSAVVVFMDSWVGILCVLWVFCVTLMLPSHLVELVCYLTLGDFLAFSVGLWFDCCVFWDLVCSVFPLCVPSLLLCSCAPPLTCPALPSLALLFCLFSTLALYQPRQSCPAPSVFPSLSAPNLPLCCATCSLLSD